MQGKGPGLLSYIGAGACVLALAMSATSLYRVGQLAHVADNTPGYISPEAVRAALLADPDMLVEAGRRLQDNTRQQRRAASMSLVDSAAAELAQPTQGYLGNPGGKHVVDEFFDYQCGPCRDAALRLPQAVKDDPELKVIFRDMAILGPRSVVFARAALAAGRQGLYDRMHAAMIAAPVAGVSPDITDAAAAALAMEIVDQAATAMGADLVRLHADMAPATGPGSVTAQLLANDSLARRVGVSGTPAFVAPGIGLFEGFASLGAFESFMAGPSHS